MSTPYDPHNPRDARAQAKAAKAYAKASRPWYKKKRVIAPAALVGLVVVASAAGGGGTSQDTLTQAQPGAAPQNNAAPRASAPKPAAKYPGALEGDEVAAPGQEVRISGWTATTTKLARENEDYPGAERSLCTTATLINRDSTGQSYNLLGWKLQDADGGVLDSDYSGTLTSGQVAPGGRAKGTVCFRNPEAKGLKVLIWEPDLSSRNRAIWLNK